MNVLKRLWSDQAGFVISAELVLIATVLVIGLLVGMATLRDSITNELADVAGAFDDVVQSYSVGGIQGHSSSISGSDYLDMLDYCDGNEDDEASADQCVVHNRAVTDENDVPEGGSNTIGN